MQLPQFNKEADERVNDFERWIYVLKNMEVLDRMPWAAKDSVFRKLAEIGEVSNMSKEERIKYDSALRHYRNTISVLQGAEDKGRMEGARKANRKNAKSMKSLGTSDDVIRQVTGLALDEIKSL